MLTLDFLFFLGGLGGVACLCAYDVHTYQD